MNDDHEQRISALEHDLAATKQELQDWATRFRNLQVDTASGGGAVQFGDNSAILRINALTPNSAQVS